jgi:hypothetical protein
VRYKLRSGEQRVTVLHLRPLRTDELLAKQPRAANAIPPAQEISDGPEDTGPAYHDAADMVLAEAHSGGKLP